MTTQAKGRILEYITAISQIAGARRAAQILTESGRDLLRTEAERTVPPLMTHLEATVSDPDRFSRLAPAIESLVQNAEDHQARSLRVVVDCASLIAGHALLEEAIHECLKASAECDPSAWIQLYGRRKVDLATVVEKSKDEIIGETVAKQFEEEIRRSSLIQKMQRLLGLLDAHDEWVTSGDYPIDMERFRQIDRRRHEVVHQGFQELTEVAEDLRYLESATFRFLTAAALKYEGAFDRLTFGSWTGTPGQPISAGNDGDT